MRFNPRLTITMTVAIAFVIGVSIYGIRSKSSNSGSGTATHDQTAATSSAGSPAATSTGAQTQAHDQVQSSTQGQSQTQAQTGSVSATHTTVASTTAQPAPTCFVETFHHKPMPGHSDEEACSRHKNLLKLSHSNVSSAHLCVRVNGTPVKFERKGQEILIGSIAGPKAAITVSYGTGKAACEALTKQDCTIPKDEFMEALGGDSDSAAQWDSGGAEDAKLNADVKKELADIDDMNSTENDRAPAQAVVFKEWIRDDERAL